MAKASDDDGELQSIDESALRREVSGGTAGRAATVKPTAHAPPSAHAPPLHWAASVAAHAGAAAHAVIAHVAPSHPSAAHVAPSHVSAAHVATSHASPPLLHAPGAVAHVVGLGAHAVAHTAKSVAAGVHQVAAAVGSVAHQVTHHAGQLIPPIHAAPAGAPRFHSGNVYRVSASGHVAPVQSVPSGQLVYVNGLHPFHDGTGDAIHGARAVSHNNGNRDVYVVYNGHAAPWSVLGQRNPAHPDAATARVTQIMQRNHGNDTFVGYSQGGAEIVNAAQRYSAAGGTNGHHGLGGVKIYAWGSTATNGNVDRVAARGAQVESFVHPTVEHRVAGIGVPTRLGDFWSRLGGGAHATVVDGKTTTSDAHTVALADRGDNVFHVYDGADPQLGDKRGK